MKYINYIYIFFYKVYMRTIADCISVLNKKRKHIKFMIIFLSH